MAAKDNFPLKCASDFRENLDLEDRFYACIPLKSGVPESRKQQVNLCWIEQRSTGRRKATTNPITKPGEKGSKQFCTDINIRREML